MSKSKEKKELNLVTNGITEKDCEFLDGVEEISSSILKIDKNLKNILKTSKFSRQEIRVFVDRFYQIQSERITLQNQLRAIMQEYDSGEESIGLLKWDLENIQNEEKQYIIALKIITDSHPVGVWLKETIGIGPTLAAIILAYFDIEKAPHAGSFHSYAGLDDNNRPWLGVEKARKLVNDIIGDKKSSEITDDDIAEISAKSKFKVAYIETCKDNKGVYSKSKIIKAISKPPYNIYLKKKCWQIGQQFVKISYKPESLYGRIYKERKAYEIAKNEAGDYADQAINKLNTTNIGKDTEAYQYYIKGQLPPSHIQARATRYAVKLFISHVWEAMYIDKYQKLPENPYVIEHMGHADYIGPEVSYDMLWK